MTVSPPYDGVAFLRAATLGCVDRCPGEVSFLSASHDREDFALSVGDTRMPFDVIYSSRVGQPGASSLRGGYPYLPPRGGDLLGGTFVAARGVMRLILVIPFLQKS